MAVSDSVIRVVVDSISICMHLLFVHYDVWKHYVKYQKKIND